jgi:hypothetical protein
LISDAKVLAIEETRDFPKMTNVDKRAKGQQGTLTTYEMRTYIENGQPN